jgi:hypothetical protein
VHVKLEAAQQRIKDLEYTIGWEIYFLVVAAYMFV